MKIHLYNINIVANKMNKEAYLLNEIILDGYSRDSINKTNPIITIEIKESLNLLEPEVIISDDIDVVFELPYNDSNYAYIEEFNRYYFISNRTIYNNKMIILSLECDDLMSFKNICNDRLLYISRRTKGNPFIEDNIIQYQYKRDIEINDSYINFVGDYNFNQVSGTSSNYLEEYNIVISAFGDWDTFAPDVITKENYNPSDRLISNGKIPNARLKSNMINAQTKMYVINGNQLRLIMDALKDNDTLTSFIQSITILPFSPRTMLRNNSLIVNQIPFGNTLVDTKDYVYFLKYGDNDVVKMFEINIPNAISYRDLEPYTTASLYIPYATSINLDLNSVRGCKLDLYYYFDYHNKNSMYYLYNETRGKLESSGRVNIGVDVVLTTTNRLEKNRNYELGVLSSMQSYSNQGMSLANSKKSSDAIIGGISFGINTMIDTIKREWYQPPLTANTSPIDSNNGNYMPLNPYIEFNKAIMTFSDTEYNHYVNNIGIPFNKYEYINNIDDNEHLVIGDTTDLIMGANMTLEEFNNFKSILERGFYK